MSIEAIYLDGKKNPQRMYNTAWAKDFCEEKMIDLYIFCGNVTEFFADKFIHLLRTAAKTKEDCALILTTYGGDPDAGYRLIRALKRKYSEGTVTIYVLGSCKSTGTLMVLGADKIVMSDFGELGPLDVQLVKEDELSFTSGLNLIQSLNSLQEQLFAAFEHSFLKIKDASANTITTRTAAEIASKLAIGIIAPISAQIDPVKLGDVYRSIAIADAYGQRLIDDEYIIGKLISSYPSHGFVIDYDEVLAIFGEEKVRWLADDELIIEEKLLDITRREEKNSWFLGWLNNPNDIDLPPPAAPGAENAAENGTQIEDNNPKGIPVIKKSSANNSKTADTNAQKPQTEASPTGNA